MPVSGEDIQRLRASLPEAISCARGTPFHLYDQRILERQAGLALAFPAPFDLRVRFAMKACPSAAVIRVLSEYGLHIDASSAYEARRAMRAGVPADHILLTAQELPPADDLFWLVQKDVLLNACSLHQLRVFGQAFRGLQISVRINPGLGSGHSNRTNVGGPSSSFGIWHEHLDQVVAIQEQYGLRITRLHSHIGSGSDPEVWQRCARLTLAIAAQLPEVTTVNLGGGFKVGRMPGEKSTDLQAVGAYIRAELIRFADEHGGRQLNLEIEPGTFLTALAGYLVATVIDVVDTGADGYNFIKLDAGMTDLLRTSLYGAQHPIIVVPSVDDPRGAWNYIVVGHCCESGDVFTPAPGDSEGLQPRLLTEARIGDRVVICATGAYGAGMAAKNYNSFPEAAEVLLDRQGKAHLIRRRQTEEQMTQNEIVPDYLV